MNRMDAEYQMLEGWVLDEGKYVTFPYLLRNSELNVAQAQSLFERFLSKNTDNSDVNASHFVIGLLMSDNGEDDGIERKRSAICRSADLAATKARFRRVDSCSIYSVQAKPLTDFSVLFNAGWLDAKLYLSPTREKTLFRNQLAVNTYQRWKESHGDEEKRLEQASVRSIFADKIKSDAKSLADQRTVKKINQLFAKSVKTSDSPEKKPPSPKSAPKSSKSRVEAIDVDDESDDEVKTEKGDEAGAVPTTTTTANKTAAGKKRKSLLISSDEDEVDEIKPDVVEKRKPDESRTSVSAIAADDVFCTGEDESSSEKWQTTMDVDADDGALPAKSTSRKAGAKPKSGTKPAARRQRGALTKGRGAKAANIDGSDNGEAMEIDDESPLSKSFLGKSASGAPPADKRQEKVMRTYVDDDGFEVTEVVMQEVGESESGKTKQASGKSPDKKPVDLPPTAAKSPPPKKAPAVLKPTAGSSSKKKAASTAGQAKISSFFKKA